MLPPLAVFSTSKGSQVPHYLKLRKKALNILTFRESTDVNIIPNTEAKVKNTGVLLKVFAQFD
jgi:hypothetical protein